MEVKQTNSLNGNANNAERQKCDGIDPDDLMRRQALNKQKKEFYKKRQLKIAAAIASRPEREKLYRYNSRFLCDECLKFGRPIKANRKCCHLMQLERAAKLKKLKDADCCYRDKKSPIKLISNSLGYYLATLSNWVYLKLFIGVLKIHEPDVVEKLPTPPVKLVSGSERFFESIIFNNNEDGDDTGDTTKNNGVANSDGGDGCDNGARNTTPHVDSVQNIDAISSHGDESTINEKHIINLLTALNEKSSSTPPSPPPSPPSPPPPKISIYRSPEQHKTTKMLCDALPFCEYDELQINIKEKRTQLKLIDSLEMRLKLRNEGRKRRYDMNYSVTSCATTINSISSSSSSSSNSSNSSSSSSNSNSPTPTVTIQTTNESYAKAAMRKLSLENDPDQSYFKTVICLIKLFFYFLVDRNAEEQYFSQILYFLIFSLFFYFIFAIICSTILQFIYFAIDTVIV